MSDVTGIAGMASTNSIQNAYAMCLMSMAESNKKREAMMEQFKLRQQEANKTQQAAALDQLDKQAAVAKEEIITATTKTEKVAVEEDSDDNGKTLTAWGKVKNFGKGMVNLVKGMVCDENGNVSPKRILTTVAVGAACAAAVFITGGAAYPFLVGAGVAMGGAQAITGAYKVATADNAVDEAAAWQEVGGGVAAVGLSLIGARGALKVLPKGNWLTGSARAAVECLKITGKGVKKVFTTNPKTSYANVKAYFAEGGTGRTNWNSKFGSGATKDNAIAQIKAKYQKEIKGLENQKTTLDKELVELRKNPTKNQKAIAKKEAELTKIDAQIQSKQRTADSYDKEPDAEYNTERRTAEKAKLEERAKANDERITKLDDEIKQLGTKASAEDVTPELKAKYEADIAVKQAQKGRCEVYKKTLEDRDLLLNPEKYNSAIDSDIQRAKTVKEDLSQACKKIERDLDGLDTQFKNESIVKRKVELQAELTKKQAELTKKQAELTILEESKVNFNNTYDKSVLNAMENRISTMKGKIKENETQIAELQKGSASSKKARIKELNEENTNLNRQVKESEQLKAIKEQEELIASSERKIAKYEEIQKNKEAYDKQLAAQKTALEKAEAVLKSKKDALVEAEKALNTSATSATKAGVETAKAAVETAQGAVTKAQKTVTHLENRPAQIDGILEHLNSNITGAQSKLSGINSTITMKTAITPTLKYGIPNAAIASGLMYGGWSAPEIKEITLKSPDQDKMLEQLAQSVETTKKQIEAKFSNQSTMNPFAMAQAFMPPTSGIDSLAFLPPIGA